MNGERSRVHVDPVAVSSDENAMRLPSFLVVGAMRSGTTSLARYLGAHPDVFVAPEKEIHFFDRYFDRGVDWYGNRFAHAGEADAVGEATQSYMYDPRAIARMRSLVPSARLLAILRHPTDRAYSHYWLNRARGLESLPFEAAIEKEAERLGAGRRGRFVYSYIDRGRYLRQLDSLCEAFPRSSVCVLIFEEMRSDPAAAFEVACRHIDVDPAKRPAELGRPINAHVTFRSPRLRRYAKTLPRSLRAAVGRVNARERGYAPMQAETRASLDLLFRSEVEGLAGWLGRDIPSWERP